MDIHVTMIKREGKERGEQQQCCFFISPLFTKLIARGSLHSMGGPNKSTKSTWQIAGDGSTTSPIDERTNRRRNAAKGTSEYTFI